MYFDVEINDVESWVNIYQNIDCWKPLIQKICSTHQINCQKISHLPPGSNAVFSINDELVIKLFVPKEVMFSRPEAFLIEKEALILTNDITHSPQLIASGTFSDRYTFSYLMMQKIEGKSLAEVSATEKKYYLPQVKGMMDTLYRANIQTKHIPEMTLNKAIENPHWDDFPDSFQNERRMILPLLDFSKQYFVHGDLKAENILIDSKQQVRIIDWADAHLAPLSYDLPYLVFKLLNGDKQQMESYFGGLVLDESFIETLVHALLIHKFGAYLLYEWCEEQHLSLHRIDSIETLKQLFTALL